MMQPSFLALAGLLCLLPAAQDPPTRLGEALTEYRRARKAGEDLEASRAEVTLALAGRARERETAVPLALTEDLAAAIVLSNGAGAKVRKGKISEGAFEAAAFGKEGIGQAHWVPKSYDPEEQRYPLFLIVAGQEDGPQEHLQERWTDRDLRENAILVCIAMPESLEGWTRVVHEGQPGGLTHILTSLRLATEQFAVDPDRIYLVGWSEGVPAVIAAGNYRPHRFAGVVGVSGDVKSTPPDNFQNLPTLLASGGARATAFHESVEGAGYGNCTVATSADSSEIWKWASSHARPDMPTSVTVLAANPVLEGIDYLQPYPLWVDWLSVEPNDPDCLAQATLDVSTNGVRVETKGMGRVTLMLSDDMLDLNRPVRFVIDGKEHEEVVERDLSAFLDSVYRGESDSGRVYVATRSFRVSEDVESEGVLLEQPIVDYGALTEEQAKERGLVQAQGEWVHRDEAKLLRKGYRRDPSGVWLDREAQTRLEKGWRLQDLVWVAPDEVTQMEKGLWKVDSDWLHLGEANRRRARLDAMWRIPDSRLLLHATVDRQVATQARQAMDSSYEAMRKVFGVVPPRPLRVALLRNEEQYDRCATGDPAGIWPTTHRGKLHTVHTAFYAESWFEKVAGKPEYRGMGVGYWDEAVPYGGSYGYHSARLALGLSYAEAIDPSPKAVGKGPGPRFARAYEAEKSLPRWLRYGAAVYAERYFHDERVQEDGDPWWARAWSLDNLERKGGLRPLEEVLAFEIEGREREDAQQLLVEVGLLVSFLVDGDNAAASEAHGQLKRALALDRLRPSVVEDLSLALRENEAELRAYARP